MSADEVRVKLDMRAARLRWLRELGHKGLPYPGAAGLNAFFAGYQAALKDLEAATAAAVAPAVERAIEQAAVDLVSGSRP